jgi:hypothetical protein
MRNKFLCLVIIILFCLMTIPSCTCERTKVITWEIENIRPGSDLGPGISAKIDNQDYLFLSVVSDPSSILILDLKDPLSPQEVIFLSLPSKTSASGLEVSGTILFASIYTGLLIMDVSNPISPKELSLLTTVKASGTAISGNYAYINDDKQTIAVADISNLSNPQVIGSFPNFKSRLSKLVTSGNLLLAVTEDGLHIIDISIPISLKEIGYYPCPGYAPYPSIAPGAPSLRLFSDIVVDGQYVYIAAGMDGIWVLDISTPSAPKKLDNLITQKNLPVINNHLMIAGKLAYLLSINIIDTIDISNPHSLKPISSFKLPPYDSIDTSNYIYSGFTQTEDYIYCFETVNRDNAPCLIKIVKKSDLNKK